MVATPEKEPNVTLRRLVVDIYEVDDGTIRTNIEAGEIPLSEQIQCLGLATKFLGERLCAPVEES